MTYEELTAYIIHYLEKDKTNRALMLSGDWGSGKSYYIKNHLCKALFDIENNNSRCTVVSLYGMRDVVEISKTIYIEQRARWLSNKNETFQTGKNIVRSLIKGAMGYFGVDLGTSDSEMMDLYRSIDLSNKLIILEDAERSFIGILDLLAYINSLVEQDNVKVLVVANEEVFLKHYTIQTDEQGNEEIIYVNESLEYLQTKEKTIGDTIIFQPDYASSITSIIKSFDNPSLFNFTSEKNIAEILNLPTLRQRAYNLRTFVYACQKTIDIYEKTQGMLPPKRMKSVFYSIIEFSSRIKSGAFPKWEGTNHLSVKLATDETPLYRFCYDYIRSQKFDSLRVKKALDEHSVKERYDEDLFSKDFDYNVLHYWNLYTEQEIKTALLNIESKLRENTFSYYGYGRLIRYFIELHRYFDFDYSICKECMIKNLQDESNEIDGSILFLTEDELFPSELPFYEEFKNAILASLNNHRKKLIEFSYQPYDLPDLYSDVEIKKEKIYHSGGFLIEMNIDELVKTLQKCSPSQINSFRDFLSNMYLRSKKGSELYKDEAAINNLRKALINLEPLLQAATPSKFFHQIKTENKSIILDRVVLLQLNRLVVDLEKILKECFSSPSTSSIV